MVCGERLALVERREGVEGSSQSSWLVIGSNVCGLLRRTRGEGASLMDAPKGVELNMLNRSNSGTVAVCVSGVCVCVYANIDY